MTKQNSWLLTKKEAEEILQNILSIYLNKMTIFIMQNQMRKSLMVQK